MKPGAEKFRIVRGGPNDVRGRTTLTTGNDCKPLGIPQTYITPYPFQMVQTPRLLTIVYEYPMAVRFVPLDDDDVTGRNMCRRAQSALRSTH